MFITKSSKDVTIGTAKIIIITFPASSTFDAMALSPASLQISNQILQYKQSNYF